MKTKTNVIFAALLLGASTWVLVAQQNATSPAPGPARSWQDGPSGRRVLPPVFRALDANHDGVIDADEIANAPAALRSLLKKGSNTLTIEDLMGQPPMFAREPGDASVSVDSGVPGAPGGPKSSGGPRMPVDNTPGRPGGANGPGGPGGPPVGDQ